MTSQKIEGISNKKDYVCFTLKKDKTYNPFIKGLLKELNIQYHQTQDELGNVTNAEEVTDTYTSYGDEGNRLIEVSGNEKIFLFSLTPSNTEIRDKVTKYILENTEFVKT